MRPLYDICEKKLIVFELEDTLEKILACNPFIFYTRKLRVKELGDFWVSWEKNCDFFFNI